MIQRNSWQQEVSLDIAGSTTFGRYSKISIAQTINMILSDNFLVPYGGYAYATTLNADLNAKGRGAYASTPGGKLLAVVYNTVYWIANNLSFTTPGVLATFTGNVTIAENEKNEIAICDGQNIYLYRYLDSMFIPLTLDFIPSYVCYQNGFFIAGVTGSPAGWRLCDIDDSTSWPYDAQHVGGFNEADSVIAVVPFPSRSNLLYVMGNIITEPWYNVGSNLFPYQKSQSYNVDYGAINPDTIAWNNNMVVWIAQNGKSQARLCYTTGGDVQTITNDGIAYLFDNLSAPTDCYGNLFVQNNHLFYQFTFPTDNLCYAYDFDTQRFYTITDPYLNYSIIKKMVLFNNNNYFISNVDGNLYEFGTQFNTYFNASSTLNVPIPRIRICSPLRTKDQKPHIWDDVGFTMEQGQDNFYDPQEAASEYFQQIQLPSVSLSISNDGGNTFSSQLKQNLNTYGVGKNRLIFYGLGYANDLTCQFRFNTFGRVVCTDGLAHYH